MVSVRFINDISKQLETFLDRGNREPIARAAQATMKEVGEEAKKRGRKTISNAGFSTRWQNTLRNDTYPKGEPSIDAAAFIFHKIPYAGVFEYGATISGRPFLWLPLPTAPKKIGRSKATPRAFEARIGKLVSMRGKGGKPLLGARVRLSKTKAGKARKVSVAALKRGHRGDKGVASIIPVFVGVPMVTIRAKFGVIRACQEAADTIPSVYAAKISREV